MPFSEHEKPYGKQRLGTKPQSSVTATIIALASMLGLTVAAPVSADAPPVRIAVVTGGGSGIEQEIVDRISGQLQNMEGVSLATVNPDWYVVCNIKESVDQMSGSIRYNGNVIVKTTDGHVLNTVAVQKYNQDYSLSPGAPLNKALVDKAARDVIANVADRVIQPLQQAILVESEGRERISVAGQMAAEGKFDQALKTIEVITPDFAHFDMVKAMHAQLELDRQAKQFIEKGVAEQKGSQFHEAIADYKQVNAKSKLITMAQKKIAECQSALKAKASSGARKHPAVSDNTAPALNPKAANAQVLNEVTASPR
jgi:hypothetical protein